MTNEPNKKIISKKPKLLIPKDVYTIDYQQAVDYANLQMEIFWLPEEIEVEKDLHDLKTNLTEAESHGVITTLKLFTLYELVVGKDYWSGRIMKIFKRPDIERMANAFSFFELNVHAPFYNKLNEVLGLNTDEFYSSYVNDPILNNRMHWINRAVSKPSESPFDILRSIGVFSMVEGAILYSNFAFLKHFQAEGKNKLINVTAGINFSVRDENIHSEAGAWLYKILLKECINLNLLSETDIKQLNEKLIGTAHCILEHESRIIEMMFSKGSIKGISDKQIKNFVKSRLDLCLEQLNIEKQFKPTYNPIKDWFYDNINTPQIHDFFVKVGNQYNRNWSERKFIWKTDNLLEKAA